MSLQNTSQIENIKVMLVKGMDGNGIATVQKTGTSGLVDTYAITFTDGTVTTFQISNGKEIADITLTPQGATDLYTFTYNDGSVDSFVVTSPGAHLQDEIDEEALKRQGFESVTTVFNVDGSITQTDEDSNVTTTVFNQDGSITSTKVDSDNVQIATATTVFNQDGSITTTATRA